MQAQNFTHSCSKCGQVQLPEANFCMNCGNGMRGKDNAHLSHAFLTYLKAFVIYLMADSVLWTSFSLFNLYGSTGFGTISNIVSYLSQLLWYTFPLIFSLLMPGKGGAKTTFIIFSAIFLAFRIGYFIYLEIVKVPFANFNF